MLRININLRRFRLNGAIWAILFVVGGVARLQWAVAQSAAPDPAKQAVANDIEIGTPSTDIAMLITPMIEGGELKDGHHGERLDVQEFVFNPVTHEVALAKNSPGPQRIYGNTRIDSAYYGSDLNIFNYLTTTRDPIGKIVLTCANKKLLISPNYVVSRLTDEPTPIDPSTYCVSVQYARGDECGKPGTTVTVARNGDTPSLAADGVMSKINRKIDVVTWTIERGGTVIKTGSFGFPVVATEPALVKYVIQLP